MSPSGEERNSTIKGLKVGKGPQSERGLLIRFISNLNYSLLLQKRRAEEFGQKISSHENEARHTNLSCPLKGRHQSGMGNT